MQLITRLSNNTLVFTLKEKQTLTSPYWLFELRFRGDNTTVKTFIVADTSSYTDRYNKFLITECASGAEVLTSGTVNLQNIGEYSYRIFEQSSASNLSIANATTECENGLIKVLPATVTANIEHQITQTSYTHTPST
tara:strand:+ start:62 stop:472 length:411 start_codon:yes stop_codon:yes gene_type:complete